MKYCARAVICLCLFLLSGCGLYQSYGYGKVARSPLPKEVVTPVFLPPGAPSISQRFRPVSLSPNGGHKGFDIFVPSRTPVLAAAAGVVEVVDLSILYGRRIMINHARVAAGFRLQTRYFHLNEPLVEPGQSVRRGELIAYSGASGMAGLFPHLHFEIFRLNEAEPPLAVEYLDPQSLWIDGVGRVTCFDRAREFPAAPLRLTYPVPCRDLAWE